MKKFQIYYQLTFLFAIFFNFSPSYAWDSVAHRVITEIAYQNLNPRAKQQVWYLLKIFQQRHPRYRNLQNLSVWPDKLKVNEFLVSSKCQTSRNVHESSLFLKQYMTKRKCYSQQHEKFIGAQHKSSTESERSFTSWHYINLPYAVSENFSLPNPKPNPNPNPPNIIWALAKAQKIILAPKAPLFLKAEFFAFYLHLVEDIHQPLHAISRYSLQTPTGDAGGNSFPIQFQNYKNLHQLWDRGLGLFQSEKRYKINFQKIRQLAFQLQKQYPRENFKTFLSKQDPKQWAEESYLLAREHAYTIYWNSEPTPTYLQQGQNIAAQQIALAGYRLAQQLNQWWPA